MLYFCTYFDSNYLVKGLALYRSLVRHASPFRLWVLCMDESAYEILQCLALPETVPISLKELERGDEELLQAKGNRSRYEYYFTCTPSLPLYIFENYPEADVITYLDADLFFFSDPNPVYREMGNGSILIIGHRFPPHLKHLESHGVYNVGLLAFRRNEEGLRCLHWWRARCLEWCYDRAEDGRFADQKYLDDWPVRFPGVVVLQHKGAGLAPWNVDNYRIHLKSRQIRVDSQPLVFFHFHGLKQVNKWLYDPGLTSYGVRAGTILRRHLYGPYLQELQDVVDWVTASLLADHHHRSISIDRSRRQWPNQGNIFYRVARWIDRQISIVRKLLQGHLLIVIRGQVR